MEYSLISTDDEIELLKNEIAEKKRKAELENLKNELRQISLVTKHELSEFDSGLKEVDTERVLTSPNRKKHFFDFVIQGFLKMASPRPVARNMLAITILFATVFCIMNFLHLKQFEPYKLNFCYFLEASIAIQILKSASRSLFIPVAALAIGGFVSNMMLPTEAFASHQQLFYQIMMIVGALGITISVFTID